MADEYYVDDLREENEKLKERVEHWRGKWEIADREWIGAEDRLFTLMKMLCPECLSTWTAYYKKVGEDERVG